jgi:hypothetical protein
VVFGRILGCPTGPITTFSTGCGLPGNQVNRVIAPKDNEVPFYNNVSLAAFAFYYALLIHLFFDNIFS